MRLPVAHDAPQAARDRQTSAEFKQRYKMRVGIEGTLSRGVRGCGIRRSRYIGELKRTFTTIE
jgi:transposase